MRRPRTVRRTGAIGSAVALGVAAALLAGCSMVTPFQPPWTKNVEAGSRALKDGNVLGATQEFDTAIQRGPGDLSVYAAVASECQKARRWDLAGRYAEKGFDAAEKAQPQERAKLADLAAAAYLQSGDTGKAFDLGRTAYRLDSNDPMIQNDLAYTCSEMPDADTPAGASRLTWASQLAQSAIKGVQAQPQDEATLGLCIDTLGWIQYKQKQYPDAVQTLARAADMAPNQPAILYHLGMAYTKMERYDDARTALERALKADPQYSPARTALDALPPTRQPTATQPAAGTPKPSAPSTGGTPRTAPNPLTAVPPAAVAPNPPKR